MMTSALSTRSSENPTTSKSSTIGFDYVINSTHATFVEPHPARYTTALLAQENLQRICCGFVACMNQFKKKFPSDFVNDVSPKILEAWPALTTCHIEFRCERS